MQTYFESLGEQIEKSWLDHSYDEEVFAELVLEALQQRPPVEHVDVADILDWIFGSFHGFRQPKHARLFGEPPLMVFQAPRFYIETLFWLSGTTTIHEHAFSGVFTVLTGSSVHSHWRFTRERAINSRMLCGRLERVSTEILRPGGARPIHSGDRLIHQLFHLELPSVTVVVRTYQERHRLPQYQYLPPGLAIDKDDVEDLCVRRVLLLEAMARGQIDGVEEYSRRFVGQADLESLYYTFSTLTHRKVDPALLEELYGIARQQHGDVVDLLRKVCDGERRTRIVRALRAKITDPGSRFLLALLMLLPDREAIFETIRLQFPDLEPLAAIESWLETMSGKETIGFELNDVNRLLFRGLVEGLDPEGLLERLHGEFRGDSIEPNRDRLLDHARQLARSELFRPLLSESPLRQDRVA